jgi:hypothetical protein
MIPRALYHGATDKFLGLIYQEREMAELRRRGAGANAGQYEEAEEESEGGVAEGVVGDGGHEG